MKIGYARVSTKDQDLSLQLKALRKAGCEKIYEDTQSGKSKDRVGLGLALEVLREGDSFVVWKLDRLGRKAKDLFDMVGDLEKNGIDFISLTDNIDTSSPAGRFFFHVMASLAQMERELMLERTKAGLDAARLKGRVGGRKRKMTDSKISAAKKLLSSGELPKDVAKELGISIPTLYRWVPATEINKDNYNLTDRLSVNEAFELLSMSDKNSIILKKLIKSRTHFSLLDLLNWILIPGRRDYYGGASPLLKLKGIGKYRCRDFINELVQIKVSDEFILEVQWRKHAIFKALGMSS